MIDAHQARTDRYMDDKDLAAALARSVAKHRWTDGRPLMVAADVRNPWNRHTLESLLWTAESPIEAMMAAAICRTWEDHGELRPTCRSSGWLADVSEEGATTWHIGSQVRIGPYRADFLVAMVRPLATVSAVVECDGHAFHERTKEQAKRDRHRDREMQAAGHMVLRFTGSEIYSDPMGRAEDVRAALCSEVWRRQCTSWRHASSQPAVRGVP